ncbi:YidH family protein [Neobacillus sp. C211]|uniref:YidH family protein n=1 Tax=unclassified Neobacillus TaxID=2675272 RepID=UPI00397DF0A8
MEALKIIKERTEHSVKYAQQHLANERTYLAWIRTAISITGVGFLTTSLHFTIKISSNSAINNLAIFLGIFACVVGFITAVLSTIDYTRKRREIQEGIFIPSNYSIIFISILSSLLFFLIFMYLTFLLFKT